MGYILTVMLMLQACLEDIKSLTSKFLLPNPYLYSSGGFAFKGIHVYLAR